MKKILAFGVAIMLATSSMAFADTTSDTQAKIDALQQQLDAVKAQLNQLKAQQSTSAAPATDIFGRPVDANGEPLPKPSPTPIPITLKPGNPFTVNFNKEAVTFYGQLDLSYDVTTKGLQPYYNTSKDGPVGNVGYLSAISTNTSYIGVRGTHAASKGLGLVYQLETQIDVSSSSGTSNSNSASSSIVKGGLTSRNSFIGIANKNFGAIKIGKTDAPYKNSTARMNPFSGELGDYAAIVGNTGGDNRVEFGTRLDHAIWYESPVMKGLSFNVLVSPGQNRAYDNSNIPIGETDCAGGNIPGSGATPPSCNDGAWGSIYSGNIAWERGPLYATIAYEDHKNVNRTSDLANLDPRDVADEDAIKGGIQYKFGGTTVSGLYEDAKRYVPQVLQYQNERQRTAHWVALTQELTKNDNINFGWGHANATPGDPGQHNTGGGPNPDNAANLYTIAFKHAIDRHFSWYIDWAETINHPAAHYDMGAGGRANTTDCHDASQLTAFDPTVPNLVSGGGPHCYAGGKIEGFSGGLTVRF